MSVALQEQKINVRVKRKMPRNRFIVDTKLTLTTDTSIFIHTDTCVQKCFWKRKSTDSSSILKLK